MAQTQCDTVLWLLKAGVELTRLDGMRRGIGNLPARIEELRALGHDIETDMREVDKAGGGTARVAFYRIAKRGQLELF